jgi:hypothetical protein
LPKSHAKAQVNSFGELNAEEQTKIQDAFKNAEDIASPEFMKTVEANFNLASNAVSDMVIEQKNSNKVELQHLLKGFHTIIDPNPRSIIRLANNYTMIRSTLIAERKNIQADKIFRWLVIEDLFPAIKQVIKKLTDISEIKSFLEEHLKDDSLKKNCFLLLQGDNKQSPLEMEEIKNIIGI